LDTGLPRQLPDDEWNSLFAQNAWPNPPQGGNEEG
jgi:hypothetical protein